MDLSDYQKAYYDGNPLITDAEYDYLVSINPSAEKTIGPRGSVKHLFKMYSLQKYYPCRGEELPSNLKDYIETPKLDGNAVELVYFECRLVNATTRGDGEFGEDITEKMKYILGTEYTSVSDKLHQITGEVISCKDIQNSRNLVAGALNTKDFEEFKSRVEELDIKFIAYSAEGIEYTSYLTLLDDLLDYDFLTPISEEVRNKVSLGMIKTDGIVYRLNDQKKFKEMGYTAKFPRGAFAVKEDAEFQVTKLINVIWETGRTGKVTPTAILEPINIDGAEISRATLNNVNFIKSLDLNIGDSVRVIRSGDIIPTIIGKENDLSI